jgi:hypothetical protein
VTDVKAELASTYIGPIDALGDFKNFQENCRQVELASGADAEDSFANEESNKAYAELLARIVPRQSQQDRR